jgi:hypothetical protein
MIWFRRVLFLAIGLVMTAIAFHFWSNFAGAMKNVLEKPAASAPPSNEVTVGIIPATSQKPPCDKKHPCPR